MDEDRAEGPKPENRKERGQGGRPEEGGANRGGRGRRFGRRRFGRGKPAGDRPQGEAARPGQNPAEQPESPPREDRAREDRGRSQDRRELRAEARGEQHTEARGEPRAEPRGEPRTEARGEQRGEPRQGFRSERCEDDVDPETGGRVQPPLCPLCQKPVIDLTTAIGADRESGQPAHFDCVLERVAAAESLGPREKLVYLGSGAFGVVETGERPDGAFTVKRRVQWEKEGEKKDWRRSLSSRITRI